MMVSKRKVSDEKINPGSIRWEDLNLGLLMTMVGYTEGEYQYVRVTRMEALGNAFLISLTNRKNASELYTNLSILTKHELLGIINFDNESDSVYYRLAENLNGLYIIKYDN
jgi:hypothetical protein